MHHVIIDCPDPGGLAAFYAELLGQDITYADEDFAVVAEDARHSGLAFQRAPDHRAPRWPDPGYPQQVHLDVMVDDPVYAVSQVVALGASRLTSPDGGYVFADPAGHPFCLIPRPSWAAPIHPVSD
nr:VOC family protein [Microlunatus panaciterrae]